MFVIPADEERYRGLVKWERHSDGHSLGYLSLTAERLQFVPHERSILEFGFEVPVRAIRSVERGDNWLWRGVVDIHLDEPLHLELAFRVDRSLLDTGFEDCVFHSPCLRLFCGFTRNEFLSAVAKLGLSCS